MKFYSSLFDLFLLVLNVQMKHGVQGSATVTSIVKETGIGKRVPPSGFFGTTVHDIVVPANNICSGGQIIDVNVDLKVEHSFIGDMDIWIASPSGTQVLLFGDSTSLLASVPCGSTPDAIDVVFDDEGDINIGAFRRCPDPLTGSVIPYDHDGGAMSSLTLFDGEDPEGTWTLTIVDEANSDFGTLQEFGLEIECADPNVCGPSLGLFSSCSDSPLRCCDQSTGAVGPACCGTTPYNPIVNACCGDGSLVEGSSDTACTPSVAPSSVPTGIPSHIPSSAPSGMPSQLPSSAPSDKPSHIPSSNPSYKPSSFPSNKPTTPLTCDHGPVCDYEFVEDESGGIIADETYYAVCIEHNGHYHQGCYPDSLIGSLTPNDLLPGGKGGGGRVIVSCGCCPETADFEVEGSTPVCQGGLDCFAKGADFFVKKSKKSSSLKSVKFDICVDGEVKMKENFYEPDEDEEVECGNCGMII